MTRFQAQQQIDDLYAQGKINRDEWSTRFDELSSSNWYAGGPVKIKNKPERKKENESVHNDGRIA